MKFIFTLLTVLTGSCLFMTSCTDNDVTNSTSSKPVEPGVYYVAMNFYAEKTATKGVNDQDQVFDTNYDYDYIYLHKINAGDEETATIELPVYECDGRDECQKGIRYRICKYEDGHAVITPIDQNGDHIETSKITLDADDECYFSSWPTNEWKLDDEQIDADSEGNNHFFRNQENNKEIYRSEDTYTIDDLAKDGDLTIVRACAGFALAGIFYDSSNYMELPGESGDSYQYTLTPQQFEEIMGDPDDWYIKIYIGGESFPSQYDIEEGTEMQGAVNGYYSSGDAGKYVNDNIDTQIYLPFAYRTYMNGKSMYIGMGYYTQSKEETAIMGNYLFTPVTGKEVSVHILIKHWTGGEEGPDEDWLKSDDGALQTEINFNNTSTPSAMYPSNGTFHTIGLLMDINQFKEVWEKNYGPLSTTTTPAVLTKSPSGATVREFTLKDAIVICDVY